MGQAIHQFCAAKNRQIQEYSINEQNNARQTTENNQQMNPISPISNQQIQTTTIQAPSLYQNPIHSPPPPGAQAQFAYISPPEPPPIYNTNEERLAWFTGAEAISDLISKIFYQNIF